MAFYSVFSAYLPFTISYNLLNVNYLRHRR